MNLVNIQLLISNLQISYSKYYSINLIAPVHWVCRVFMYLRFQYLMHRQCVGLVFRRSHVRGSLSAASLVIRSPARIALRNTWGLGGTALCRVGGCNQSIGSTVSDVIVRSWLWLTATRGSPLGYFSKLLQVVDNLTHILW